MAQTVDEKLLKQTKFPLEFNQKVDMQKVNIEVIKKWIAGKISDILGSEDDVVTELCFNLLEGSRYPNIKSLQIQLTGFLDKDAANFCKELWTLCLSAQSNPQGVPKELLEAKKLELIQEKIEADKAAEAARHRRDADRSKDREMHEIRERERNERGRGRGRGRGDRGGRGGRGGGGFDRRDNGRRAVRDSRSPPPNRNVTRNTDSYLPDRPSGDKRRPRVASPSASRSRERSNTPEAKRRHRSPRSSSRDSSSPPPNGRRRRSPSPRQRQRARHRTDQYGRDMKPARDSSRDRYHSSYGRSSRHRPRRSPSRSSPSASSRSGSPPPRGQHGRGRHGSRRRSPSGSSSSSPSRSPSAHRRGKHGSSRRRHRRSPSRDDSNRHSRADVRKDRNRPNDVRRGASPKSSRSRSRTGSPPAVAERSKRRRSLERYEPRPKRRKDTPSPTRPTTEGDAVGQEENIVGRDKDAANRFKEKLLKQRLLARKSAPGNARRLSEGEGGTAI